MAGTPKIKVKSAYGSENKTDIFDLDQAKNHLDYGTGTIVMVEGQVICSHEGLVQLASRQQHRDKEFLEVMIVPLMSGG